MVSPKPPFAITSNIRVNAGVFGKKSVGIFKGDGVHRAPVNIAGLKTPDAILVLIQNHPQLTRQLIADTLKKDVRTIVRAIECATVAKSKSLIMLDK